MLIKALGMLLLPAFVLAQEAAVLRPARVFDGESVHFDDGSSDSFDTIIWGTGYRIGYPFLEDTIMGPDFANAPPLYLTPLICSAAMRA